MENNINEYLKQLSRQIEALERNIKAAKESLKRDIESDHFTSYVNGAERIAVIKEQLSVLRDQKQIFEYLFIKQYQ